MKKMKVFLCMICTALLLSPLTGCGSKEYSGDADHYRRDPWASDYYYRSRVHPITTEVMCIVRVVVPTGPDLRDHLNRQIGRAPRNCQVE